MSEKSGFEELMSQVDGFVFHPLTLSLLGFAVLCMLLVFAMPKLLGKQNTPFPIDQLKALLGMPRFPTPLFVVALLLWGTLLLTLTFGLFTLLIEIVWNTLPSEKPEDKAEFRFLLTKTTALTAVLGAMVALPFTVIRLKLTTAQNRHNEDVLFNEKLNDANNDLHARYQTSEKQDDGTYIDIWKDDIIRRNGAIDRLGVLASEGDYEQRKKVAPQIARMLCVYLREMTRDHPAEDIPKGMEPNEIWEWANALELKRSDMETAAQVLGRLHELTQVAAIDLAIDLTGVNLQAMQLDGLNFENAKIDKAALDGAKLNGAKLNGAKLSRAQLNGAQLSWAKLNWAELSLAELNGAELDGAELNGAQLSWAKLNWAKLYEAKLNGAELVGAKLNWAELKWAELRWAELRWAELKWAELNGAELNGALLDGTKLNGAELDGALLDEKTHLRDVHATAAALRCVNLKDVSNLGDLVKSAFGDASVILPDDIKPLVKDKWPDYELNDKEYDEEWARFKEDPDAYIPPQPHKD